MQFTQGADEYEGEDYLDLYLSGTQVEDACFIDMGEEDASRDKDLLGEKEVNESEIERSRDHGVRSNILDELLHENPSLSQTSQCEDQESNSSSSSSSSSSGSSSSSSSSSSSNSSSSTSSSSDSSSSSDEEEEENEYLSVHVSQTQLPDEEEEKIQHPKEEHNLNHEVNHVLKKAVSFYEEEESADEGDDEMELHVSQTQLPDDNEDEIATKKAEEKNSGVEMEIPENMAADNMHDDSDMSSDSGDEDGFEMQVSQTQMNDQIALSDNNDEKLQGNPVQDDEDGVDEEDELEMRISQTQLQDVDEDGSADNQSKSASSVSSPEVIIERSKTPEHFSVYDISPSSQPPVPSTTANKASTMKNTSEAPLDESPTQIDSTFKSPDIAQSKKPNQPLFHGNALKEKIDPFALDQSDRTINSLRKVERNKGNNAEESSVEWLNVKRKEQQYEADVVEESVQRLESTKSSSLQVNGSIKELKEMELNLSQSADADAEELVELQQEYAKKLQELLDMKKSIETAAKSKRQSDPKSASKPASDNLESTTLVRGIGTLECADMLVAFKNTSPQGVSDAIGVSSNPARRFNTSFAPSSNTIKTTPEAIHQNEEEIADRPSSGKFRRKFASGASSTSPAQKSSKDPIDLTASENLFEFAGNEGEIVDSSEEIVVKRSRDGAKNTKKIARFEEEEEAEFEGDIKVSSSKGGLSSTKEQSSAIKPTADKNAAIWKDLPDHFLQTGLPSKWTSLWNALEAKGWYWTRGRGLISYYYLRPNAKPCNPYVLNEDYFTSSEDVVYFLKRYLYEDVEYLKLSKTAQMQDDISNVDVNKSEQKKRSIKLPKRYNEVKPGWEDDSENLYFKDNRANTSKSVAPNQMKNAITSSTANNSALTKSVSASNTANSKPRSDSATNISGSSSSTAMDIRTVPWKDLWKILRGMGWTWDFGPGHLNYYYKPGFDYKKDKVAILNEHKFENDESIRRYIRKQIRQGNSAEWSMFYVSQSATRLDSLQESQLADAHMKDPSWMLSTHRKRRESNTAITNNNTSNEVSMEEDNHDEDEFTSKSNKRHSAPKNEKKQSAANIPNKKKNPTDHLPTNSYEEMTQVQAISPPIALIRKASAGSSSTKKPNNSAPVSPQATRYPKDNSLMQVVHSAIKQKRDRENLVTSITGVVNNGGYLLQGWNLVFSGIEEKLRDKLENEVKKQGGKVLDEIPKDMTMFPKDKLVLISQPKDFRKLKYLFALLTGIKILHSQWLLDSLEMGFLQQEYPYQLPATYSALHSCYVFQSASHLTPSNRLKLKQVQSSDSKKRGRMEGEEEEEEEPFLANLQVLNLTGMKVWDDVLLASGAIIVDRDESHLQYVMRQYQYHNDNAADLILFDPVVYARSFMLIYGNSKMPMNNARLSSGRSGKEKKALPTISELEIQVLQYFNDVRVQKGKRHGGPIVASIDWLTHVISLKQFIDVDALDLFSLPNKPIQYPTAFKADYELDLSIKDNSGERYSKYDLVYFSQLPFSNSASPPNKKASSSGGNSNTIEALSIGKIIGFSRRNEDSAPMVRIQLVHMEQEQRTITRNTSDGKHNNITIHQLAPNINPITETPIELLISAQQLVGKVVLLHRTAYAEVKGYTTHNRGSQDSNTNAISKDKVFSTTLLLEEHWPIIPWNLQANHENSEDEGEDDSDNHPDDKYSKKRKIHMHSSQDF